MRTCLTCKHRRKRLNISRCYICAETQSFVNWESNLVHNTLIGIAMLLILLIGLLGLLAMLSMANHDNWWTCVAHGVGGAVMAGGSLMALAYLAEREERRNNVD